ncbi:MAG: hypothetical protein GEU76_03930 [Alphaproteobacteria bacterium]|nr:hypothetical protein [Alphaproteobacteria bacterium]
MAALSSIAAGATIAAAGVGIAGGLKTLTSKPKAPSVSAGANPGSVLGIGFNRGLSTPGLMFEKGTLTPTGSGIDLRNLLELFSAGGTGVPGSLASLRAKQAALGGNIPALRAGIQGLRGDFSNLRAQVVPGFGALTEARVKSIRDAASESIGNLRETMARRNVLGSSFATDTESRTRLAFAQEESNVRAEAKVAEIGATQQLISDELNTYAQELGLTEFDASLHQQDISNAITQSNLIINELTRQLQELNIAGSVANGVASAVANQGMAEARLQLLSSGLGDQNFTAGLKSIQGSIEGLGAAFGNTLQQQARIDVASRPDIF